MQMTRNEIIVKLKDVLKMAVGNSNYDESKYDENSNITEQAVYDSEAKLEYMYKDYEYKKVKKEKGEVFIKIKHNRYNSDGVVDTIFKWEYDEDSNCTGMVTYSPDGKEITRNEF